MKHTDFWYFSDPTYLNPASGDRFRMKGALFEAKHFNSHAPDIVGRGKSEAAPARTAELEEKLNRLIEYWAAYNRERYGNLLEPLTGNDNRDTSPTPTLGKFLHRNLSNLAIESDSEDLGLWGVRVKQRQLRRRRNAALGKT